MNLLDLFSGIGAFSLGLERSGAFRTVAFCEIDPFCRRVLAKHWPEVPCYDDVRSLTAERLRADGISVDAICGGFPCQPHSLAGSHGGSNDDRDMWPEFARLIREIRPQWVLAENVPGIRSSESGRFFGGILRDLAATGFDAEWHSISAADIGTCHQRDRTWVVAYPASERRGKALRLQSCAQTLATRRFARVGEADIRQWPAEAVICRGDDVAANRVDRVRALGNSLVPRIAELIGRSIAAQRKKTAP